MKVDCAQFFYPSGDGILDDISRILCDTHKQILFRDRFNYFNKFSDVNWIDTKDSLDFSSKDFSEICKERAKSILEKNDYVNILSSNGVDSCCVISSFLSVLENKDQLRIFITNDSIKENPEFYEKFKNKLNFFISENSILVKDACEFGGEIVNGHTADQMFGMGKFCGDKEFERIRDIDFMDGIKETKESLGVKIKNNFDDLEFHLKEYFKIVGLDIRTYGELVHLLNFSHKWTFIGNHITFDVKSFDTKKESISFFKTKEFSDWAFSNFFEIDRLKYSLDDPTNYKKPLKDFVKNVMNFDLSFKPKSRSWQFHQHTVLHNKRLWIKTENEFLRFDKFNENFNYAFFSEQIKKNFFGKL